MNISNLEARSFPCQTSRAKRRKSALVGYRGQRICLIHELGKLTRSEKLLDDGGYRLGVDQVVGHQRFDLLKRHSLLDRALHAHQADSVLVLE